MSASSSRNQHITLCYSSHLKAFRYHSWITPRDAGKRSAWSWKWVLILIVTNTTDLEQGCPETPWAPEHSLAQRAPSPHGVALVLDGWTTTIYQLSYLKSQSEFLKMIHVIWWLGTFVFHRQNVQRMLWLKWRRRRKKLVINIPCLSPEISHFSFPFPSGRWTSFKQGVGLEEKCRQPTPVLW